MGYFGRGIYLTNSWKYAIEVYSPQDKVALLCWTVLGNTFPVVDGDMKFLEGKTRYQNYDCHYVPVKPRDPTKSQETVFFPCTDLEEATYDEYVFFHHPQVVPQFLINFKNANAPTLGGTTQKNRSGTEILFPPQNKNRESPPNIHG